MPATGETTGRTGRLRSPHAWLWALAALTMLLHLAAGLYIGERHFVGTDAGAYEIIARSLLAGNGFDCGGYKAWYAPLYPLLLTLPFGLTPRPFLVTLLGHGLLVVGLQWLAWRLVLLLGGRPRTGVLAAALVALDPLTFYFSVLLLTETLFTFLSLLFLWLLLEFGARPRRLPAWVGAGVVMGMAVLTRPVLQGYFVFFAAGWLWYGGRARSRRLMEIAAVGLTAAAVMLPWTIRNYNVFGRIVTVTNQSGIALYAGNNPLNRLGGGMTGIDYDIRLVPGYDTLGESELNAELQRLALTFMRENPLHTAKMAFVKLSRAWSPLPSDASGHGTWYHKAVSLLWFVPVMPFFLWGLWAARGSWRLAWPLYAYLAFMLLFIAAYYGTMRFRLPLHPLFAVWAALGFARCGEKLTGRAAN